jgi:DNA-directed RNA polymerase subunit delta
MNIKNMNREELEQLSYTDITYHLLKNGPQTTANLFKEITTLLELPENAYFDKIGDYYTSLTTDKRFIILKDGNWDLRSNHSSEKFIVPIDEEDEEDLEVEDKEEELEEDEENFDNNSEDEEELVEDEEDDVLEDLSIVDEDFEI